MLLSETLHFDSLCWCNTRTNGFTTLIIVTLGHLLNWIHCTPMQHKVREFGNIGCILVVHPVFPSIGSPIRCIPYCCIQCHWLRGEISSHRFCSSHFSDRNIVHIKSEHGYTDTQLGKTISNIESIQVYIHSSMLVSLTHSQ